MWAATKDRSRLRGISGPITETSRAAAVLCVLVVIVAANVASAELCDVTGSGFDLSSEAGPRWDMNHHSRDFLSHGQSVWLDLPWGASSESRASLVALSNDWSPAGRAMRIDSTGEEIDRWRYVYLDRQRYRFLDVTQYNLLGGPSGCGWRWRCGTWPDVFMLPPPGRCVRENVQPIPEPLTVAFLAFGALVVLRARRSVGTQ